MTCKHFAVTLWQVPRLMREVCAGGDFPFYVVPSLLVNALSRFSIFNFSLGAAYNCPASQLGDKLDATCQDPDASYSHQQCGRGFFLLQPN